MKEMRQLFNRTNKYNPKLNYLICKNIASNFPENYEEIHIRNCYQQKEEPINDSEKIMILIKEFLYKKIFINVLVAT